MGARPELIASRVRSRVEVSAAATGDAKLGGQAGERHAGALLRLGARHAERPRAPTFVEQREGRGADDGEHREADEQIGEAHAGSVVDDAARVNVQ